MNINSLSLLNKEVIRMLGVLLEREVSRDDPEWAAARALLTVSEKVQIKPSRRQHKKKRKGLYDRGLATSILVSSSILNQYPQSILMKTSYKKKNRRPGGLTALLLEPP